METKMWNQSSSELVQTSNNNNNVAQVESNPQNKRKSREKISNQSTLKKGKGNKKRKKDIVLIEENVRKDILEFKKEGLGAFSKLPFEIIYYLFSYIGGITKILNLKILSKDWKRFITKDLMKFTFLIDLKNLPLVSNLVISEAINTLNLSFYLTNENKEATPIFTNIKALNLGGCRAVSISSFRTNSIINKRSFSLTFGKLLPHLKILNLYDVPLKFPEEFFSSLNQLEELTIEEYLDPKVYSFLPNLTVLRGYFSHSHFKSMAEKGSCPNLRILYFHSNSPFTGELFSILTNWSWLKYVFIDPAIIQKAKLPEATTLPFTIETDFSFENLLKDKSFEPDFKCFHASIALKYCISENQPENLSLLLNHGASPNLLSRLFPSKLAEKGNLECYKILYKYGSNFTRKQDFIDLCSRDRVNIELLRMMLDAGVDPNTVDLTEKSITTTVLVIVAETGDYDAMKELIKYGANVDVSYGTPLIQTMKYKHCNCTELLLEKGASLYISDVPKVKSHGIAFTPLIYAIMKSRTEELVKILAKFNANFLRTNSQGLSPLAVAAYFNKLDAIQFLLEQKTVSKEFAELCKKYESKSQVTMEWNEQLKALTARKYTSVFDIPKLKKKAKTLPRNKNESLVDFEMRCNQTNVEQWEFVISSKEKMDLIRTPLPSLLLAILKGTTKQFKIPAPTSILPSGDTLFHLAIIYGNTTALAILIEEGLDVNAQNKNGETPTMTFLQHRIQRPSYFRGRFFDKIGLTVYDLYKLKFLHRCGANFQITNNNKESVLHIAVKFQDYSTVKYFLTGNEEEEVENKKKKKETSKSPKKKQKKEKDSSKNNKEEESEEEEEKEEKKSLVDVNAITNAGESALWLAFQNFDLKIAELLLSHKASIQFLANTSSKNQNKKRKASELKDTNTLVGTTLLHQLAKLDPEKEGFWSNAFGLLFKYGGHSFVNVQDSHGKTPLHYFCAKDCFPVIQLLIASGAEVSILDKSHNLPFELVRNKEEMFAKMKTLQSKYRDLMQEALEKHQKTLEKQKKKN